jgi:ammonia channel protein AmtB
MKASVATGIALQQHGHREAKDWVQALLWSALCVALVFFLLPSLAHATDTGTGGSSSAQARINTVAGGWQNIVMGVGVAILTIAWTVIGYSIAFGGKTLKDVQNPLLGTTIAGLAPILVGWMFS